MAAARKSEATRELLVRRNGSDLRVTIPADAKVTFSAVNPGADRGYNNNSYCLRIYTTASNQLAVFTNVQEFRDLSLKVLERKVERTSKRKSVVAPDGEKHETQDETQYEWAEVSE